MENEENGYGEEIGVRFEKDFPYMGLGFPVTLKEAKFEKIAGEEYHAIPLKELSFKGLVMFLCDYQLAWRGHHLKFLRQSFEMSWEKFAVLFGLTDEDRSIEEDPNYIVREVTITALKIKIKVELLSRVNELFTEGFPRE